MGNKKENKFKKFIQRYKQLSIVYLAAIAISVAIVMVLRPEPLYNAVSMPLVFLVLSQVYIRFLFLQGTKYDRR